MQVKKSKTPFPKARVGIIGYPNTGKSSLINHLVGKKKASRSSERGQTTSINEIRFTKDIILLDTPGVIPSNEDSNLNQRDLKSQVQIGAKTPERIKDPDLIVFELMKKHPGLLQEYYKIETSDVEEFLEILGKKLNFLSKGGVIDTERTARVIIKAVQENKIKVGFD